MVRLALIGFVWRLAIGTLVALVLALLLALVRDDGSFIESFRVSVWLAGCLLLLLAVAGHSPTMRTGTIDPWLTSFYPKLRPKMSEPYSGTRISSAALFALAGVGLFGLGIALS